MTSASAPGKVVLSGEYAVLDGAPAIGMALNRRALVTIAESPDECHVVTAPGYTEVKGRFTNTATKLDWLEGREQFILFDAAWRSMAPEPAASLAVTLDTQQFVDASGTKAGIGSSAALIVALVAAIRAHFNLRNDLSDTAHAAHRLLQGDKGSGVDIACSVTGGIIDYRMQDRRANALEFPRGLHWGLLSSGVASSTAERITRFEEAVTRPSRELLAEESQRVAESWRAGDADAILGQYAHYCEALLRFSVDHGLGIFDAGHEAVTRAASRRGLVYKPCGAGGGDIGIVMGKEASQVDAFASDAARFGFRTLDARMDARGVTTD